MGRADIKSKAVSLRRKGRTYSEICLQLGVDIPKSTLSYWCREIPLPAGYSKKIREYNLSSLQRARVLAVEVKKSLRLKEEKDIREKNIHLARKIKDKDSAKIALAMLYLGEGMKRRERSSIMFGNSDSVVISLFLYLLRAIYKIDESKFRCTLQCRADQDIEGLEKFWSSVTNIPLNQFYKARIDPRTIGKPSVKPDYKGVCRIDYFSAKIFSELLEIPKIIYKGL
jgi:hypothetical protein